MVNKIVGTENAFCIHCNSEVFGFASNRPSTPFYVEKHVVCLVSLENKVSEKEWKLSKQREVQLSALFP